MGSSISLVSDSASRGGDTRIRSKWLENVAELKEPFVVAGVAHAPADKKGTKGGFGQNAGGEIVRKSAFVDGAVHLAGLVGADGIDLFAYEGRQGDDLVQVSAAK